MSFDKNPSDIAMEVLPDEAAPPSLATAQDLFEWVAADAALGKQQRTNELSAIRALGKVDHTPLAAIPLDPTHLFDVRYKAIRKDKALKKRRRGEVITLLNRVLKRAGIITIGSRRSGNLGHSWIELLPGLSQEDQRGLSTFARYCSGRGIEPQQVTAEVWNAFVEETLHAAFRDPRGTIGRVANASNRARRLAPGWPLPELPKLVNPRLVSLPKAHFPESFWADLDHQAKHASCRRAAASSGRRR